VDAIVGTSHGLSTTIAWKSLILVAVGPGVGSSPRRMKKPVEIVLGEKGGRIEADFLAAGAAGVAGSRRRAGEVPQGQA
jgi:hypothetical protein